MPSSCPIGATKWGKPAWPGHAARNCRRGGHAHHCSAGTSRRWRQELACGPSPFSEHIAGSGHDGVTAEAGSRRGDQVGTTPVSHQADRSHGWKGPEQTCRRSDGSPGFGGAGGGSSHDRPTSCSDKDWRPSLQSAFEHSTRGVQRSFSADRSWRPDRLKTRSTDRLNADSRFRRIAPPRCVFLRGARVGGTVSDPGRRPVRPMPRGSARWIPGMRGG